MPEGKPKKKGLGCLPTAFLIVIILLVAAYAAVKIMFPAERVKAEIIKRAQIALGRTVELDNVSLSIFPGPSLDLQGVRIFNPQNFPGGTLLSLDRLRLKLKLMPLLRKQFMFSEISVDHPVVELRKTVEGKTNYDFPVTADTSLIKSPLVTGGTVSSKEAALTVFAFDWAAIKNGDITYINDSAETKTTISNFGLETRLNLEADGKNGHLVGTLKAPSIVSSYVPKGLPLAVNLTYNADIDFQNADLVLKNSTLEINGIVLTIDATVRNLKAPQSAFASIKAQDVALEPLLQYLPASKAFDPKNLRLQGKLDAAVESRMEFGTKRTPDMSGTLKLKDLTVGYQTIAARVHFDELALGFVFDSVSFASTGGQLYEENFSLAGTVKNWRDPVFDISTKGRLALAAVQPFLNPVYNHKLSGTLDFDLNARGTKSDWVQTQLTGTIGVDKGYYFNDSLGAPLEQLDMKLTFAGQRVSVDTLYAKYPGIRTSLTGTVKNGFAHLLQPRKGYPKPYLDFRLHAPFVNYDVLVPTDTVPVGTINGMAAPAPIFIPDIEAGGKAVIDTLVYSKVEFTNITGDVTYNAGIITFKNATGRVYSGSVAADGEVDIRDFLQPVVACTFTAKDVEADDFMTRFANLGGHLYGKVNMQGSFTGKGSEIQDFIKTLTASGTVDMSQGRLVNFDLINTLAGQFGFKTFQEEDLRQLAGDIKIHQGKLLLDGTKVMSRMGDWDLGGTVAFLDKTLDLNVGVYLSPEFSNNLNLMGGLLKDDKGRVKLNFTLGGAYDKPTISNISTDKNAVQKKVGDKLKKEADNLLKGLFKKP